MCFSYIPPEILGKWDSFPLYASSFIIITCTEFRLFLCRFCTNCCSVLPYICSSVQKPQNCFIPAVFFKTCSCTFTAAVLTETTACILLLSRIENITDTVTKHIEDNYTDHDCNTRVDHQPWCFCHVCSSFIKHQSPFRCRRCGTKTKEG